MLRGLCFAAAMAVAPAMAQAPAQLPPPPLPGAPLEDCSLYRYGEDLDLVIAATLKNIGGHIASSPELSAAAGSGRSTDVTEILYRQGLIKHVPTCNRGVLRASIEGWIVRLEIAALQGTVCSQLLDSPRLQASGLLVTAIHLPTGEARCGGPRNPIPGLLTLGRLTQAGRMLPGDNVVTIAAQGPFAAASPQLPKRQFSGVCPSLDGTPDKSVENIIKRRSQDSTDFPKNWVAEPCFNLLGGPSSLGVCTTAMWNRYHNRLYAEFENIIDRAQYSNDPLRIYSAAAWLIDLSDPAKVTIRGYDYAGRDCDMIRNRFVIGCGLAAWDYVKDQLPLYYQAEQKSHANAAPDWNSVLDRFLEDLAWKAVPLPPPAKEALRQCTAKYGSANEMLDMLRPVLFSERRNEVLSKVAQRVQQAMALSGYGNCDYYGQAVARLDYEVWKDQYKGGMTASVPVDWEHDFQSSARKCLVGN